MAHIHELIDLTVTAYICYQNTVLLISHRGLGIWLPIGGHVELAEDPEEALTREIKEESGLSVMIMGSKPDIVQEGMKILYSPTFLDIHAIKGHHRHIGMVYFATADTNANTLEEREHSASKWFTKPDLDDPAYNLLPAVRYYADYALTQYGTL